MNSREGDSTGDMRRGEAASSTRGERSVHLIDNRVDSRELFAATREIIITHGTDVYRLRLTMQNKLILTK
jgi:hemin uptake protein HemP